MRVTFVVPYGLAAFDPAVDGPTGGAEQRAAIFARGLARDPRFAVRAIVCATAAPVEAVIAGVHLSSRPWPRRQDWLDGLADRHRAWVHSTASQRIRLSKPGPDLTWKIPLQLARSTRNRALQLWRGARYHAVPRAEWTDPGADVIVAFVNNAFTADILAGARVRGQHCVLCLASDADLDAAYRVGARGRGANGQSAHACAVSIRDASVCVVQSERQDQLLRQRFGRTGVLIRNPVVLDDAEAPPADHETPRYVLWVGKTEWHNKRPLHFVRLAQRHPRIPFVMAIDVTDVEQLEILRGEAPANLEIRDTVSYQACDRLIAGASLLVSTSRWEGVPNTFLQAGAHRVPVLSCGVDPDGMLAVHGGGVVAGDGLEQLSACLGRMWQDVQHTRQLGVALRHHVEHLHRAEHRIAEFAKMIEEVALTRPPRTANTRGRSEHHG